MNENTYPQYLFKYRNMLFGYCIARYRLVKDNIYEDTTCSGHPHCRISVTRVGDHYELKNTLNESAIKYAGFHRATLGDTHFYADEKTPKAIKLNEWIKSIENKISVLSAKMSNLEAILADSGKSIIKTQDIASVNFGDTIYLADEKDTTFKIRHKVIDKDGLCYLLSGEYTAYNTDDRQSLKVVCDYYDYDKNYMGFVSKEDLEGYRRNNKLAALNEDYENCKARIERNRLEIERYRTDLGKLEGAR